ncbi:FOG: EAL domain protein [gamma proteobacterium NOR5-3]|nr:FOG: EAL domain protein [gamma proteobacterium NOR5-3]
MGYTKSLLILLPQMCDTSEPVVITKWPFAVGRASRSEFRISAPGVSAEHAVFKRDIDGEWFLEDSQSTNGTFVNGERIGQACKVVPGDLIHFATQAYRVGDESNSAHRGTQTVILDGSESVRSKLLLSEALESNQFYSVFQPIFDVKTREPVAWEALGRGVSGGENMPPAKMFDIAERFKMNYPLSRGLRDAATDCVSCGHCWQSKGRAEIWINLHPSEVMHPSFQEDLLKLQSLSRDANFSVVIEAPETWVSRTGEMQALVARVRAAGMRVAYDDFGAGQSRLEDLMSVPPDYIKFDRTLVSNLDTNVVKRDLLKAMIKVCNTLNAITLAEGVETAEEYVACRELGVELIQGFYLERPKPAYSLFTHAALKLPTTCQHRRLNIT